VKAAHLSKALHLVPWYTVQLWPRDSTAVRRRPTLYQQPLAASAVSGIAQQPHQAASSGLKTCRSSTTSSSEKIREAPNVEVNETS